MDLRTGEIVPSILDVPEKDRKYFVPHPDPDAKTRDYLRELSDEERAHRTEKPDGKAAQRRLRQMLRAEQGTADP